MLPLFFDPRDEGEVRRHIAAYGRRARTSWSSSGWRWTIWRVCAPSLASRWP